jgi:hypothetical protein
MDLNSDHLYCTFFKHAQDSLSVQLNYNKMPAWCLPLLLQLEFRHVFTRIALFPQRTSRGIDGRGQQGKQIFFSNYFLRSTSKAKLLVLVLLNGSKGRQLILPLTNNLGFNTSSVLVLSTNVLLNVFKFYTGIVKNQGTNRIWRRRRICSLEIRTRSFQYTVQYFL